MTDKLVSLNQRNTTKAELLVPAGNLDRLKTAILYGADSVYMGPSMMSLRSKSEFSLDEIKRGAEYVRKHNKKFYLTCNLFSHNTDIENLPLFTDLIKEIEPDGVLVADPGVFMYFKQANLATKLHISTQANICSWLTVKYWQDQGADLCVLAREVSFAELKEIREKCKDIKLEAFIHGAMCMTYSGRCLLSNFMAERGANQGSCAHSCRWKYKLKVKLPNGLTQEVELSNQNKDKVEFALEEECRPGEYFPLEEDERGSYILNSKDLCLMPVLNDYLALGVDTLKIEGRHKSEYYVAMVTRTYRRAIDDYYDSPETWNYSKYMPELYSISNRGYTLAFHGGRLSNLAHNYQTSKSLSVNQFAGIVLANDGTHLTLLVKNYLEKGDALEFITPEKIIRLRLYEFTLAGSEAKVDKVSAGSAKSTIIIPLSLFNHESKETLETLVQHAVVRKINPNKMHYSSLFSYQKNSIKTEELRDNPSNAQAEAINQNPALRRLEKRIQKAKDSLHKVDLNVSTRKPMTGEAGCCFKGCNGCLVFWQNNNTTSKKDLMQDNPRTKITQL